MPCVSLYARRRDGSFQGWSLESTHEPKRLILENKGGLQKRGVSQDTALGLKGLLLPNLGQRAHEQNYKW